MVEIKSNFGYFRVLDINIFPKPVVEIKRKFRYFGDFDFKIFFNHGGS